MRDAASRATFVSPTEVRCLAPARRFAGAGVRLCEQRWQHWAPPLPLSYYVPPLLTRVLPPAADLHEDTTLALTATHTFERDANLLCAFREALPEDVEEAAEEEEEEDLLGDVESAPGADEIVSASLLGDGRLSCVLPASARPRTVRVAISTSGGAEWTSWDRGMSTTQYDPHAPMEIVSAAPVAADVAGGTAVVVRGRNLAPIGPTGGQLHCHFGGSGNDDSSGSVPATFEHTSLARCESPAGVPPSPHTVVLGVSTNGVVDGATANFTYYRAAEPPTITSISPRYADISQTTPIRIVGSNFAPTGKLYCKFGSRPGARSHTVELATTAATFVSVDEVVCESPPAADHLDVWEEATVRVTTDGERYSTTAQTFTYYTSPIVSSVAPTYGDLASADPITVRGAHFFRLPEGGNIACRYSAVADGSWIAAVDFVAEGSYVSDDTLRCAAPTAATGRTVAVAISVNHQFTFTPVSSAAWYTLYDTTAPPTLTRIAPAYGPLGGGADAPVTAVGLNFAPTGAAFACRFGDEVDAATFLNVRAARCVPPPVEAPMTVAFSVTDAYDASAALEPLVVASRPHASALVAEVAPAAWLTTPAWWRPLPPARRFGPDDSPPPPPLASPPPPPPPLLPPPPPAPTSHVWAPALSYTYYDPERPPAATAAVPPYAYARPGAPARLITVRGSNFVPAEGLACKFDDVEVEATFVDSAALKCAAPAREDTVQVALCVRTLGQDFGPDCASFGYYRPPTLSSLSLSSVDKDEATLLGVGGANFAAGATSQCVFIDAEAEDAEDEAPPLTTAATIASAGALSCYSPVVPTRRTLAFSVEIGGVALGRSAEHHILRCGPPGQRLGEWRRRSPARRRHPRRRERRQLCTALRCFFGGRRRPRGPDLRVSARMRLTRRRRRLVPLTVDHADGDLAAPPFRSPTLTRKRRRPSPPPRRRAPLAGAAATLGPRCQLCAAVAPHTPSYLCRFGDLEVGRGTSTAATFVTGRSSRAAPPSAAAHTVALRIIIDGCASDARCRPPTRRLSTITTLRRLRALTPTILWRSTSRSARSRRSPYAAAASHRRTALSSCRSGPSASPSPPSSPPGSCASRRRAPPRRVSSLSPCTTHSEERREAGRRCSLLTTTRHSRRT